MRVFEVVAFSETLWEDRNQIEMDFILRGFSYGSDQYMRYRSPSEEKAKEARDFVAGYFGLDPEDVLIQEIPVCVSCGMALDLGDNYCRYCGVKVEDPD